jgi:serine/threonine protein kinase
VLGQRLHNFAIKRLLGEGGMSSVYEAEHSLIRRKVAVKVLKSELSVDGAQVQRFFNEARATSAIRHPNIVEVIDVGRLADGVPYLVMELLEGESLGERLERLGSLEIPVALDFAHQAASALIAAHALRVVHRDLKPDNLFIVPDQRLADRELVKVLDFGIAKLRGELAAPPFDTMVGAVLGTPPYMSPEQCRGLPEEIDERTDVYALGIILYEMLCGRPPFLADGAGELMMMHMTAKPQPPSELRDDISPHLERVILRTLEKRREDRFASMSEFDGAVTEILISLGAMEPLAMRRSVPAAVGGGVATPRPSRAVANFESDTTLSAPPTGASSNDAEREQAVTRALSRRAPQDTSASGVVALEKFDLDQPDEDPREPDFSAVAAAEFDEEPPTSQLLEVDVDLDSEESTAPTEVPVTAPPLAAAASRSRLRFPIVVAAACLLGVVAFGLTITRSKWQRETSTAAASRAPSIESQSMAMSPAEPQGVATSSPNAQPAPDQTSSTEAVVQPTAATPEPASAARATGRTSERAHGQPPARPQLLAAARRPAAPQPTASGQGSAKPAPAHSEKPVEAHADNSKLRRGATPPRAAALSMTDFEAETGAQPETTLSPSRVAASASNGNQASQAESGYLSLDSAPWSDVFLGAERLGTTPLIRLPLAPGKYLLTLRNPELGTSTSYAVEIQAGKTVSRLVGWEHK